MYEEFTGRVYCRRQGGLDFVITVGKFTYIKDCKCAKTKFPGARLEGAGPNCLKTN